MISDSLFSEAKRASRLLPGFTPGHIDAVLTDLAQAIVHEESALLAANARDLARMDAADPRYDRLRLTSARLRDIADGLRQVATLPTPLGRELTHRVLPNGLELSRVTVPFGVIGIIFEARPNVCPDCFALCLKAGSACVLKCGSDARYSCEALLRVMHQVLLRHGMPAACVSLISTHEATDALLQARGSVDLIIPRGSKRLIDYVRDHARVPVIETGAGVVHTYVDRAADLCKAVPIVLNAKTRRVSVCNALDCLLVHRDFLPRLAELCAPLLEKGVAIEADDEAYAILSPLGPALVSKATADSYGTEFLSMRMALRVVCSMDEALDHIACYGSGHSECIVTEDYAAAQRFLAAVDAACVYHNAPTSFTDGGQFGLGAEIGISTQKLHARGPMALEEITTYKWMVRGNGQVRP